MMSLQCTPDGRRWDRQSATGLVTGAAADVKWERCDIDVEEMRGLPKAAAELRAPGHQCGATGGCAVVRRLREGAPRRGVEGPEVRGLPAEGPVVRAAVGRADGTVVRG